MIVRQIKRPIICMYSLGLCKGSPRLVVDLVLNPNSLWTKVVNTKYQFQGTWHTYNRPKNSSIIQRKILRWGTIIQDHICLAVGDGSSMHFLNDSWMSSLLIYIQPTFINPDGSCDNLKVSELIIGNRKWNLPLLSSIISIEMMQNISMRPVVKHTVPDQLMQKDSLSKTSMIKDLYSLVGPCHVMSKNSMGWIWKLRVPPRVRFFWWKVRQGRLPCKSLLLSRSLIDQNNVYYDLCPASFEDITHVLITFSFANSCQDQIKKLCQGICLPQSILRLIDLLPGGLCNTMIKAIIAITTWLLWDTRNGRVFNHNKILPNQLICRIHQYLPLQQIHYPCPQSLYTDRHCGAPNLFKLSKLLQNIAAWSPPPVVFLKLIMILLYLITRFLLLLLFKTMRGNLLWQQANQYFLVQYNTQNFQQPSRE